jgi:chromosome segregation ATPase
MPRTHSEAIDELTKRVDALALALEGLRTLTTVESEHFKGQLKELQASVKEVQALIGKAALGLATLEERMKSLEKGTDDRMKAVEKAAEKSSDRRWQLAPMVLTGVSIFISLVSAVVAVIALTKK